VSLRKQGANKGAVTSFLISTPESGVDSIAVTYALLDPLLTVLRPVVAFFTALTAGVVENLTRFERSVTPLEVDRSCPIDNCCDGMDCPPEVHRNHHRLHEKVISGLRYAFTDFWDDLAGSFLLGLLLAGIISALIPESFFTTYLGQGLPAMLIMLVVGMPLYVCATASTPIAAALIIKGVSPGAALVFLLAGPATNMAALTILVRTLGARSTAIYLSAIAVCAVLAGLTVDGLYGLLGISAQAVVGQVAETIPYGIALTGAVILMALMLRSYWGRLRSKGPPIKIPSTKTSLTASTPSFPMASDRPACGST
jgi:uncharacterized membrane protein YraQ (UPF0718 family)